MISSSRQLKAMPASCTHERMYATRPALRNCRGETFTATCSTGSPSACHAFICAQASRIVHCPICSMNPDSSASGMNRVGRNRGRASGAASAAAPPRPRIVPGAQVDLRLVVQLELAALDGEAQVAVEDEARRAASAFIRSSK